MIQVNIVPDQQKSIRALVLNFGPDGLRIRALDLYARRDGNFHF